MNILNPESFEDVSIDLEATMPAEAEGLSSETVKAKDVICKMAPGAIVAISAAVEMVRNPIVKFVLKCAIFCLDGIRKKVCEN